MSPKASKLLGFSSFVLFCAGFLMASFEFDTTSSTRRGAGMETLWYGFQAVFGLREAKEMDLVWVGRGLVLAAFVVLGLWIRNKVRARAGVR